MKKLFFIIGLFFSLSAMAQPTNYTKINMRYRWLSGMFDSALYVPRYNGTPSGVRINETSAIDGMIAMDTTNNRLYIYSGGSWIRLAAYSEVAAYTAGNGLTLSGSQFKLGGTLTDNNTLINGNSKNLYISNLIKSEISSVYNSKIGVDTIGISWYGGGNAYISSGSTSYFEVKGNLSNARTEIRNTVGKTIFRVDSIFAKNIRTNSILTIQDTSWSSIDAGLMKWKSPQEYAAILSPYISNAPGVDSLWRVPGVDSIFWSKNGIDYALKDSTGGGGSQNLQTVTDNGNTIDNNFIEFDGGRVISGDIISDNFNRYGIGANYDTAFPNVTRTYNGSYLEVNNGAGNFNNYITYVNPTGRNRWTQTIKFVPVNLSGTTYGIGIGLMSSNSFYASDFTIHFILDNSSNKGKMTLYNASNSSVETSGSGITFNAGDTLFATVERSDNVITSTFYNQTQNISVGYTYTFSPATAGAFQMPNTAKTAIYFFGGNQKIFNYTFASKETKDNVVVIGNSITAGYMASTMSKRYASMLFPGRYQYEVSGGPGDRSADVVSKLEEIKLLQPRYAVLNIGVNDAQSGVSTSTFSTNIQRIVDTLQNNNITPIIISSCPNNSYNLTPYNDTLSAIATRQSIKYVNTFDSLRNGTNWKANYTTGGIHPNDSGHLVIARIITRYAPEILGDTVLKVNRPVYNSSVRYFLGLNELNGNLEFNTVSATPTTNYVELAPSATQTGTSIDVTGDGGTIDNIAIFRSAATYSSIVVDATKVGGTGQAALLFNKNGTNAWQFGSDFAANGTKDFYVYDNTNSRNPFYITSGGDVRIGGTSGYAGSQVVTIEQGGDVGIGVTNPADKLAVSGNIALTTAGNKLKITTGSNASIGTGTLSGGTVIINTTAVTASSLIFIQYTSCSNCGSTYIGTITAGTSFVVNSTNGSDASTFNWWIVN